VTAGTGGAPLRIALLLESDGPGGAETMLLHLAESMRQRGHHVLPVGPAHGCGWLAAEFRDRGFETAVFRLRQAIDPLCVLGLARLFSKRRIQVAHSHEFSMAVYGAAAARIAGVAHLITMHGGRDFGARRRRTIALRWACRASNGLIAVSEATRLHLQQVLELDGVRIDVVPNAVPHRPGERDRVRREVGLEDTTLLIVAVGSLYPVKGYDVLVEALGRLAPDLPWRLALAGRGQEEARLRDLARRHRLDDRVHLLGYRDDIPDLLAAADIFAMPSRSEGLPLALLEAMLAGRPVVASAVGGIPDAVGARGGILVPPEDVAALAGALRGLLVDGELRCALGSCAAEIARTQYRPDAMADAYENRYLLAVGAAGPAG
jgi:glycosyltransferase involved in cell wall biosynthesis